ncbi:MAG: RecX family transcriptional regulator [Bacteroidia bacterium]|nr:RecX family transcriptional regulator [Bacteroidia bacterium]
MTDKISSYYLKAASYCSIAERCKQDIIEKLKKWGAPENEQPAIINKLIEDDFLNERRYAVAFARDKFRFNQWGSIKISYSLKQKGIASDNIKKGLASIEEREYTDILKKLIETKLKSLKRDTPETSFPKVMRFITGKGFEPSIASNILKRMK